MLWNVLIPFALITQKLFCYLQYNAGLYLESFSVELVILAIWKKALEICGSWLASITENEEPGSSSENDPKHTQTVAGSSQDTEGNIDFNRPSCVSSWTEKSFLVAFNRAEKLSHHIRNMDGSRSFKFLMPFSSDLYFQGLGLNLRNCLL